MAWIRVRARAALIIICVLLFGGTAGAQPAGVEPPHVLEHIDAVYPPSELARGVETTVVVHVVVEKDGTVSEAQVTASGGAPFDEAALAAVRRWRFRPATKDGVAVRARIRVPFHFAPGVHAPAAQPRADKPAPSAERPYDVELGPSSAPHAVVEEGKAIEVHVQGRPNPPHRGTSDFRIDDAWLRAAPHESAGAMLRAAPGFTVTRPEGDAVAHRIMLRGFDADHGQDIALRVGGIPLNQPSHIHGQGYADLQAIIPETVRSLRVLEGVYDPRQGDFAVAGSVDFDLGVVERGLRLSGSYGSFHEKRLLVLWAPEGESEDTFAAAELEHTEGFGDGTRGALSGGASGQYRFDLPGDISGLAHLSVHGARANFAGVLRRDDVDRGRLGFYDAYRDATARSQSALTTRSQVGTRFDRASDDGSAQSLGLWTTISTFRQRINLTGYTQRSRENPDWAGRGDLVEQHNDTVAVGGSVSYRTRRFHPTDWLRLGLEVGAEGDTHGIEQAQNLLQAPQNETWDRRVDASVRVSHAGLFVDGYAGTEWITLRGGLRADLLLFDVDDRLGNFIPAFQEPSHIVGFRRTAAGVAWGPRVTLQSDPLSWLRLSASYGMGYRSPQARQLEEGESAPFAVVHSYEGGVTFHRDRFTQQSWAVSLAAYETRLSYDLAFDATEARLERVGPTTRTGGVAHLWLRAHPFGEQNELTLSASGTFVHARLEDPPPPTPDNPTPAYREGQLLPYVPPLVLRVDAGWRATVADDLWGEPLWLRAGYGLTFLSERPLPYAERAAPVTTMDASLALRRDFVEAGVTAFNLLDVQYAETEYSYVSNWSRERPPSLLPARHLSAGPPLSVLGTVTLYL